MLIANIHAGFHLALIGGNLTAQSMGSYREIGGGIQMPEAHLQALLPFPALPPERLRELARRLRQSCLWFLTQPYWGCHRTRLPDIEALHDEANNGYMGDYLPLK